MDTYTSPCPGVNGSPAPAMTSGATELSDRVAAARHVDDLPVRDALIGDGAVIVQHGRRGPVELHLVDAGVTTRVGRFANAAKAWEALDQVDHPEVPRRRWSMR